jgi:hypothetical protein
MQRRSTPLSIPTLSFSGHAGFVLRGSWLKRAYDQLTVTPELFFRADAFVLLGVDRPMAQAIAFWGRVCGVFERADHAAHRATWLGDALLADQGWDPFLVTPATRWLLHWQLAARPEAALSWYFAFNLLRRGEFSAAHLAEQIAAYVRGLGLRPPAPATLSRDVDCLLRCYLRPRLDQSGAAPEDALGCPLHALDLIQRVPGQPCYRMLSGARPDLPTPLVAFAALQQARRLGRASLNFNELAYGERSPGRLFRLDEQALLGYLLAIGEATAGQAVCVEQGDARRLRWRDLDDPELDRRLLTTAYA